MKINKFDSKAEAAASAGEALNNLLLENIKSPILLLVSAGSAFEILEYVGEKVMSENLTVCMLDDRFSENPEVNNFLQLQKLDFYTLALSKDVNFFGTLPRPNEKITELAERFEGNLKNWRKENPNGLIVATFGMGADGHTAGIFPESDEKKFANLMKNESWVIGYNVGDKDKYSERVTTTLTFFKEIDFGIGFVCGEDKKLKFNELQQGGTSVNLLPALSWHSIKNLQIFTDIK
jgi:6-phosphogluconolactonase/glucosamine-6-phosphate isomerase/deaminase